VDVSDIIFSVVVGSGNFLVHLIVVYQLTFLFWFLFIQFCLLLSFSFHFSSLFLRLSLHRTSCGDYSSMILDDQSEEILNC
jgi:Trk-type K+ transport system membrane component